MTESEQVQPKDALGATDAEVDVEPLLEFLRDSRGLDFTGYKRPSLVRRIRKRMDAVGVSGYEEYRDFLEVHPSEHNQLVESILINVTSFFRDETAWRYLAEEVVPAIVEAKGADEPIRIWSAGCATGEEPYSLAMVFADHLGIDAFKKRVKIYATDTDDSALADARSALYTEDQLAAVPAEQRDRFFEATGSKFGFRRDCRRQVIFGRHDVTKDSPISRIDLLVCRNVLMYLVRDTQRRVLGRFHYALGDSGSLFLGKAETIFSHADLFTATSQKFRVFRRSETPMGRDGLLSMTATANPTSMKPEEVDRLNELATAALPVSQLVVNLEGFLVGANAKARAMFGLNGDDIGRPFHDLDVSFRPVELRSRIEQAYAESRPVVIHGVSRPLADGKPQFFDVTVAPLVEPAGLALGVSIGFTDVTELGRVKIDLERSTRNLKAANEGLHTANEELETSNEELQSTNEELETTNEELQSANEELETMNEELQSANEELETMNEELLLQATEIERGGEFLAMLLNSLSVGVAVVTDQFDVVVWNRAAEDLFGLRAEEARDRSFLALDIGLPVGDIGPLLHTAAQSEAPESQEVLLDAVNRKGTPFRCRVTVRGLDSHHDGEESKLVVLLDPLPDRLPDPLPDTEAP